MAYINNYLPFIAENEALIIIDVIIIVLCGLILV